MTTTTTNKVDLCQLAQQLALVNNQRPPTTFIPGASSGLKAGTMTTRRLEVAFTQNAQLKVVSPVNFTNVSDIKLLWYQVRGVNVGAGVPVAQFVRLQWQFQGQLQSTSMATVTKPNTITTDTDSGSITLPASAALGAVSCIEMPGNMQTIPITEPGKIISKLENVSFSLFDNAGLPLAYTSAILFLDVTSATDITSGYNAITTGGAPLA